MVGEFRAHQPRPPVAGQGRAGDAPAGGRPVSASKPDPAAKPGRPREIGGPSGPEPTRYGDWERKGICVDF